MSAVSDDAPDERLLALTRGELAAFGAFHRRHEDQVLGHFLACGGDPEVAADLTAETFAAALASAHRFRPRKTSAAVWLFGIARTKLAMSRRRGRVELPGDQQDDVRARVIEELDDAGIANDLRSSEAIVRKRGSRGLGTLPARPEEKQ